GVVHLHCWAEGRAGWARRNGNGLRGCVGGRCPEVALLAMGEKVTEARPPPVRFRAKHVSIGESGGEYFQVSFDNEDDDLDLSPPDQPYLLVQRQFEDDDGGVCYIETLDHDTYTGHYRLRLIEFTPTRLAFEIVRKDHKYVEVTFHLNAKRFSEIKRIVHIIFGVRA